MTFRKESIAATLSTIARIPSGVTSLHLERALDIETEKATYGELKSGESRKWEVAREIEKPLGKINSI